MLRSDQGYPNFYPDTGTAVFGGVIDIHGRPELASFTLATPVGTDRDITVQLQDATGDSVVGIRSVTIHVFADSAGAAWAVTGGTTGIVTNGAGSIETSIAKKVFLARCDATGILELRWTDTASEVAFLGIEMPSGDMVISEALTI